MAKFKKAKRAKPTGPNPFRLKSELDDQRKDHFKRIENINRDSMLRAEEILLPFRKRQRIKQKRRQKQKLLRNTKGA